MNSYFSSLDSKEIRNHLKKDWDSFVKLKEEDRGDGIKILIDNIENNLYDVEKAYLLCDIMLDEKIYNLTEKEQLTFFDFVLDYVLNKTDRSFREFTVIDETLAKAIGRSSYKSVRYKFFKKWMSWLEFYAVFNGSYPEIVVISLGVLEFPVSDIEFVDELFYRLRKLARRSLEHLPHLLETVKFVHKDINDKFFKDRQP